VKSPAHQECRMLHKKHTRIPTIEDADRLAQISTPARPPDPPPPPSTTASRHQCRHRHDAAQDMWCEHVVFKRHSVSTAARWRHSTRVKWASPGSDARTEAACRRSPPTLLRVPSLTVLAATAPSSRTLSACSAHSKLFTASCSQQACVCYLHSPLAPCAHPARDMRASCSHEGHCA